MLTRIYNFFFNFMISHSNLFFIRFIIGFIRFFVNSRLVGLLLTFLFNEKNEIKLSVKNLLNCNDNSCCHFQANKYI